MTDKAFAGPSGAPAPTVCACRRCLREVGDTVEVLPGVFVPAECAHMILCSKCGNKRCPHATDHRLACTNSNEPGQAGSAYA